MVKRFLFILAVLGSLQHAATAAPEQGLLTERLLHTGDIFTPQVLHKGEWFYGQPFIPLPGWSMWGVTNRITVELDYTAWLRSIPDMNVRISLTDPDSKGFQLASETMLLSFNSIPTTLNFDADQKNIFINRHGAAAYTRLNAGYRFTDRLEIMSSFGGSYSDYYHISDLDVAGQEDDPQTYRHYVEPVGSLSGIYRISPGALFYINGSYGETFVIQENRPRKEQITWGFTFMPFRQARWALGHNLHLELMAWRQEFRGIHKVLNLPIPLGPYLYWQWGK